MSKLTYYKKHGPVSVYKMHAALVHLLESMEKKLPRDLYQDMYATLLGLGTEQIVRLHASLKAGDTAIVLSALVRKTYSNKREYEANERILRHVQMRKMRRDSKATLN